MNMKCGQVRTMYCEHCKMATPHEMIGWIRASDSVLTEVLPDADKSEAATMWECTVCDYVSKHSQKQEGQVIEWEKLATTINRYFGKPYLPEGMVVAWVNENGFHLYICGRDIALEPNGNVWASGMCVSQD